MKKGRKRSYPLPPKRKQLVFDDLRRDRRLKLDEADNAKKLLSHYHLTYVPAISLTSVDDGTLSPWIGLCFLLGLAYKTKTSLFGNEPQKLVMSISELILILLLPICWTQS